MFTGLFFLNLIRPFYLIVVFCLFIFCLFISNFSAAEEEKKFQLQIYLTKKQAFEVAFPGADTVDKERRWLTDFQKKAIEDLTLKTIKETRFTFYVGIKKGKPMGYMLIDNIIGKSFPITFYTLLNLDGTVRGVEIMVYREPQGWEVRNESFRSQFFGRDTSSDSREIHSITGATLSVNALRAGVYKALAAYKVLYLDK